MTGWRRIGTLGFGESYMDGWWDCDAIDQLIYRAAEVRPQIAHVKLDLSATVAAVMAQQPAAQPAAPAGVRGFGERHYDLKSNELYAAMLDKRMAYSCGYWQDARHPRCRRRRPSST